MFRVFDYIVTDPYTEAQMNVIVMSAFFLGMSLPPVYFYPTLTAISLGVLTVLASVTTFFLLYVFSYLSCAQLIQGALSYVARTVQAALQCTSSLSPQQLYTSLHASTSQCPSHFMPTFTPGTLSICDHLSIRFQRVTNGEKTCKGLNP